MDKTDSVSICKSSGVESVGGEGAGDSGFRRRRIPQHGVRRGRSRVRSGHPPARDGVRGVADAPSHVNRDARVADSSNNSIQFNSNSSFIANDFSGQRLVILCNNDEQPTAVYIHRTFNLNCNSKHTIMKYATREGSTRDDTSTAIIISQ